MLRELHLSGLGVFDDLDLELGPGLNVLTGETGAGKTLITVALSLALGARGTATLVRPGAKAAKVQARFDPVPGSEEWTEGDEGLVLARTVAADGKGGARVGGQLATSSLLAQIGTRLVELHGQHQTLRLLDDVTQTEFLDRAAGTPHLDEVRACRVAADEAHRLRSELDRLADAARDRERELDLLAYQVREIDAVAPGSDETDRLEAEESRLGHAERLLELVTAVDGALTGDDGVTDRLASVAHGLDASAGLDPSAEELAARARTLTVEATELARDVRTYGDGIALDPERLDEVRSRIAALKGLRRKYGATDADVLAFLESARERLALLAGADERLLELEQAAAEAAALLQRSAAAVSLGRTAAAPVLAASITEELRELGMPNAEVEVALIPLDEPGSSGAERVELRFRGGTGQRLLPLAKAASGGELSRVMLACRSVLADLDEVPTLVFDEVDAGIGGQAGLAVGRRLARLAATRQVLVVTHLPQIACFADLHVRVRKDDGTASAEALDDAERVRELSRMLAGLETSSHAVSHAEELLAEAARVRAGA